MTAPLLLTLPRLHAELAPPMEGCLTLWPGLPRKPETAWEPSMPWSASMAASCLADYDATYAINNKVSFAFIVLCPEHAATIAKDFPDQRAARDFMRETAAMPYKFYSQETCVPGKDFGPYDENTFIPRFKKTESIKFFVSGGPGKQSQIWVPFPQVFKPVSKKIAE